MRWMDGWGRAWMDRVACAGGGALHMEVIILCARRLRGCASLLSMTLISHPPFSHAPVSIQARPPHSPQYWSRLTVRRPRRPRPACLQPEKLQMEVSRHTPYLLYR